MVERIKKDETDVESFTRGTTPPQAFPYNHLLGLENIPAQHILTVLDNARAFKEVIQRQIKKVPALRGKTVVNLFFESSTRTRTSFELAAKRLSADLINFNVSTSSVSKGESLLDTAKTIKALGADVIVMRHSCPGAPHLLARLLKGISIVNAGDGCHEHPTQALLDLFTIREHKGRIEGLTIAIVGDILHSRVARSNVFALKALGAKVRLVGPRTLVPERFEELGTEIHHNLESGIKDVDVINILRIQMERQRRNYFPGIREYQVLYRLDEERISIAKPDVLIMHPGPINRDIEIGSSLADSPYSVITEQVSNGVAVRMAVLYLLCGGKRNENSAD